MRVEPVEVITRYGGFRHLARRPPGIRLRSRCFTFCCSTSSWTIEEWARLDDHPLGLTKAAMEALPLCGACARLGRAGVYR